ncbi:hypothetical protein FEM48_Zijuj07G0090600 [Ziziphus jujuba var. spinosa]|uniref:RING-type domain-containing protein n=1 Tax=Ziziphus jujuba var. spinosa TaxID=714518 RepID=A0A978V3Q9_ZIZJJ|nr:hypothetical protein FEM48_Zijuj07G0090600 [Ziziphus jujuba var. spinosa]
MQSLSFLQVVANGHRQGSDEWTESGAGGCSSGGVAWEFNRVVADRWLLPARVSILFYEIVLSLLCIVFYEMRNPTVAYCSTSFSNVVDAHLTSEANMTSNYTWSSSSQPLDFGPPAPPFPDGIIEDGTPILYPSVDSSPIDLSSPTTIGIGSIPARAGEKKEDDGCSSSCIICLDAPVESAWVPCGHMVGCMSCLNEINDAKGTCPVCRAKIHQVLRVYTFLPLNLNMGKLYMVSET